MCALGVNLAGCTPGRFANMYVALKRGQCGVMERVVGMGALAARKDGMGTATAAMSACFDTAWRLGDRHQGKRWSRSEDGGAEALPLLHNRKL